MNDINYNLPTLYLFVSSLTLARYFIFAGIAYFIFWVWKQRTWHHRRIQSKFPEKKRIRSEIFWSCISLLIIAGVGTSIFTLKQSGYTLIYDDIALYGWPYFGLSIVIVMLLHDTYFYWTHRLLHWQPLYRSIHIRHHKSTNPSPFAAFSFHPIEAFIQIGLFPFLAFLLPLHIYAIFITVILITLINIMGHLGYEIYPKGFTRNKFGGVFNASTHHNMHHQYFHCNYGFIFSHWDRLMNTMHQQYHDRFDEIKNRPRAVGATTTIERVNSPALD